MYEVYLKKNETIVNIMRMLCWHWCDLAAKDGGLECTCMNNDDFTVLVSGGSRCCWVNMCTVRLSHSKWLSKWSNESASNFVLSLSNPPQKLFWLKQPKFISSQFWRQEVQGQGVGKVRFLPRFLSLACRWPVPCCVLTWPCKLSHKPSLATNW